MGGRWGTGTHEGACLAAVSGTVSVAAAAVTAADASAAEAADEGAVVDTPHVGVATRAVEPTGTGTLAGVRPCCCALPHHAEGTMAGNGA